jgi:hypothetical protein
MSYVYIQSEKAGRDECIHDLWTVGFYKPNGKWEPESDHANKEDAAKRVAWLNGASTPSSG